MPTSCSVWSQSRPALCAASCRAERSSWRTTTRWTRSGRGRASWRGCARKRRHAVSRTSVAVASHVCTPSACIGRSRPKPSIGSCASWHRNWRCAKSPWAERSTPSSRPTVGGGSATRPLRSTRASVWARASRWRWVRSDIGVARDSSIKAKRWLVKRLGELRFLADALDRGELGYEAARLVARVATRATVEAWVTRATERTLRHLREEIDAAELLARWSDSATALPPSDADVRRVEDLERAVVTGKMSAPPVLPSRASAPPANVTLRLRVHASTARDFRHWEAIYLRHRGSALSTTTFLRFACELFIDTWCPQRAEVEYAQIYQRDRYRCQSPCCGRRDVTPHHLRFRSHGGDDSPENVTSLCTWCHLEGIHRGHISARPPASSLRWTYGRGAHTVVEGRRRVRAEPSVDRRA
jgi:hypothetical protein